MTSALTFRRFQPGLWLTACSAILFSALLVLGFWQLERLAWKEALIADLQTRQKAEALIGMPNTPDLTPSLEFRRISLTGRFLPYPEFHFPGRSHESAPGLHIAQAFLLSDGRTVIVNRGWIPQNQALTAHRNFGTPSEDIRLEGILRRDGWTGSSTFRPDNDPASNTWFYYDSRAMAAEAKVDRMIQSYYVVATKANDDENGLPVPVGAEITLTNNHLVYAITWFTLALVLVVIYVLRGMKPKETDSSEGDNKP